MARTTIRSSNALLILTVMFGFSNAAAVTKLKLFILGGQSNSIGVYTTVSQLPDSLKQPQKNVKFYYCGNGTSDPQLPWQFLRVGSGAASFDGTNCCDFGSEISFGHDMALGLPNDSIAVFKGGTVTALADGWLPPSSPGGPGFAYTRYLRNGIKNAVTALGSGYQVEYAGMIWMQGESDAQDQTKANAYQTNLTNFISDVRTDLATPNMPFMIAMISTYSGWTYGSTVRAKQTAVASSVPNVGIFDTKDFTAMSVLNSTGGHYDGEGQRLLGVNFASGMLKLIKATGVRSDRLTDHKSPAGTKGPDIAAGRSAALVISDMRGRTLRSRAPAAGSAAIPRFRASGVVVITAMTGTTASSPRAYVVSAGNVTVNH